MSLGQVVSAAMRCVDSSGSRRRLIRQPLASQGDGPVHMIIISITESGASVTHRTEGEVASSTDMERVDIEKHLACGALSQGLAKGR